VHESWSSRDYTTRILSSRR